MIKCKFCRKNCIVEVDGLPIPLLAEFYLCNPVAFTTCLNGQIHQKDDLGVCYNDIKHYNNLSGTIGFKRMQ